MSYQDDKRELLKLKQGIIEESETIKEEEKPVYELHGWKRVSNFFYHYKWYVVVAVFFAAVTAYFLYTMLSSDKRDIRVLSVAKDKAVAENIYYKTMDFEHALELYCPDFDKSGYVHVEVFDIDLSENVQSDFMLGSIAKLTGEINYGEAAMMILDTPALETLIPSGDTSVFVDLEELYPDCPRVDGYRYYIKDSEFAMLANYVEACPDDLFIVIRQVTETSANRGRLEKAQKLALEVMDNIVSGNYAGWEFEEGRIYGVEGGNFPDKAG